LLIILENIYVATKDSLLLLVVHSFNGLFSRTTWVRWHKKSRTSLELLE